MSDNNLEQLVNDLKNLKRSHESRTQVKVQFINLCPGPVEIRWLDFNGHEIQYGTLQPKSRYNVSTFITHPWVFFETEQEKYVSVQLRGFIRIPTFEFEAAINILRTRIADDRLFASFTGGNRLFPVYIVPTYFPLHPLRKLTISKIVNLLRSYEDISQLEVPEVLKPEIATLYRARNPLF